MAQPTPYIPVHTFVSDSATLANFPGQQLDVEFNDIKVTTDQIRANLALIQRDDGAVANSVIGYDQLSPSLQSSGIAPANAWTTATAYLVGTPVVQAGTLYRCLVNHTSGVFATDLAAGKWIFVASLAAAFVAGANLTLVGNVFSVSTSPSFVTPNLNVAIATSINKVALTAPANGSTLTIADGKTLTANNTLTFAGNDGSTVNLASGGNVIYTTNKLSDLAATTSAQLATAISDETGSGLVVFNTSPTLVTPILGVAAATSINKVALTAPATGSTLTILDGKTLTANNSLTLAGTDATVQTFPSTSGTVVSSSSVNAVTNAMAAQMAAWTLKGNNTSGTANAADIDVTALTLKASPVSADIVLIQDSAAGNAFKKTTVGALSSAGSVSSIAGNTGSFTLSHGLTNATNDLQVDIATQRGYLSGLVLSTAGSSATFGVSIGVAVDSTNADFMKLTSAYTKTTAAWVVGSGNGALDTGAIANATWYHVYEIKRPDTGVVDIAISLSATAPTTGGNIPAAYTLFRRIGAMKTNGSAQWMAFVQNGDDFTWAVPVSDVSAGAIGTTVLTPTVSVPTGVSVTVTFFGSLSCAAIAGILFYNPTLATQGVGTPSGNGSIFMQVANQFPAGQFVIRTNTSAQIAAVCNNASGSYYVVTTGWTDRRGRDT